MTPEALQGRLIDFGAGICGLLRRIPQDIVGIHLMRQLARSATSPAANYAEARSAESRRDFLHKMQICLKELRETAVWIELISRVYSPQVIDAHETANECDELIAIFVYSIKTAKSSLARK